MDEDGYWNMLGSTSKRELVGRLLKDLIGLPMRVLLGGQQRQQQQGSRGSNVEPGTLILVRHGESLWNANKTFTGEEYVYIFLLLFCSFGDVLEDVVVIIVKVNLVYYFADKC